MRPRRIAATLRAMALHVVLLAGGLVPLAAMIVALFTAARLRLPAAARRRAARR